ncbi:hypothetical protein WJX84_005421 [Apatococcus fuscideae]|uniref:CsbD family protein n=1 Tax=Apatococcus fuscideae TaxID=2026836 RepID=A0AAW1T9I6_9CHLO
MAIKSGDVDIQKAAGQTATGAQKETFGTGTAAQSEAGKKGAEISGSASDAEKKARGQKAADTRAERYGEQRHT